MLTVSRLFKHVDLLPCGPVSWGLPLPESRCGVYVVSLVRDPDVPCGPVDVSYLGDIEAARWCDGQPVIYIGRTRRPLRYRLGQFYRHEHGKGSPHRGGQAIKLLTCELWVFWASSNRPTECERAMIDIFIDQVGKLPFANRRR